MSNTPANSEQQQPPAVVGAAPPGSRSTRVGAALEAVAQPESPARPRAAYRARSIVGSIVDSTVNGRQDAARFIATDFAKILNADMSQPRKRITLRIPDEDTERALITIANAISSTLATRVTQEQALLYAIHATASEIYNKMG